MQKFVLLGAALVLFGGTGALATTPEATSAPQTTLDRGLLTTSSSDFILRVDLRSGQAKLIRLDGRNSGKPIRFNINTDSGTLSNIDFMQLGAPSGGDSDQPPLSQAACTTEASNVTTAATLVSNTCKGRPSAACTSATTAFDHAVGAFRNCIGAFTPEK